MLTENLIIFARTFTADNNILAKAVNKQKKFNPNIYLLNNLSLDISSTLIRNLKKEVKV